MLGMVNEVYCSVGIFQFAIDISYTHGLPIGLTMFGIKGSEYLQLGGRSFMQHIKSRGQNTVSVSRFHYLPIVTLHSS